MSTLTLEEFKRAFTVRPTDGVCPCHCGSCDCPGWKIVTDTDRAMAEAFDRLPEILKQAAYEAGRKMAESTALTLEEFKRAFTVRPTDAVCPCHCGSCDCPGWKIVGDADRALGEAYERLPEILKQAAYDLGRKMAEDLNRRFWEAFTGQHERRRIRIPAGTPIYLTPDGFATTQATGCKIGDLNNPVEFEER